MADPSPEERIARLLGALPPAPAGWVRAAKDVPLNRGRLGRVLARAEVDAAFRAALLTDLEATLREAGYAPDPELARALRGHLGAG